MIKDCLKFINRFLVLLVVFSFSTGCFFKEEEEIEVPVKIGWFPSKEGIELSKYLISIQDIEIKYSKIFVNCSFMGKTNKNKEYFTNVSDIDGEEDYKIPGNNVKRSLRVIRRIGEIDWDAIIEGACYDCPTCQVREPIKKPAQRFKEKKFKGMNYKRVIPEDYYLFCYTRKWKHCYYNVKYSSGVYCEHVLADGLGFPETFYAKVLDNLDLRVQKHMNELKKAEEEAKRLEMESVRREVEELKKKYKPIPYPN